MKDDFLTIYLKGVEDGKDKKKQEIDMLERKLYDLQQENKQLKEEIENIKDFNNKLQASKNRLDKDDYNLAHILTELEEWLEMMEEKETIGTYSMVQDKIQELKEKYKWI